MGLLDSLLGKSSAEASRRAAADTYAKQSAATGALRDFGDTLPGRYDALSRGFDPYVDLGRTGVNDLEELLANPESIRSTPGYQFNIDEGVKALDRSAASRGGLNSGRQSKDLMRFAQGTADNTYGTTLDRLLRIVGGGQAATGAQVGTQATGIAGQTGTRTSAYAGDMGAAGTIGQGEVAAEQAKSSALSNLLGSISYLGGSFLGGPMGSAASKKMFG